MGILAELEKGILQSIRPAGIPVQQGPAVFPLLFYGGLVQIAAEGQIGQGPFSVEQRHNGLADAHMAAVELKAPVGGVAADFALVAGHTAPVSLRKIVHHPAEGRVSSEQVDVPALGVQNIGRQAGEEIEIGNQSAQTLLVKQRIHLRQSAAPSLESRGTGFV